MENSSLERRRLGRGRVVVVDDDEKFVEFITLMLNDEGYEVISWKEGLEPSSLIESASPDLVLLDLWMPAYDGLKVLGQVKCNPKTASIPILIVTATDVPLHHPGTLDQADAIIPKPFDFDDLLTAIHRMADHGAEL